MLIRTIPILTFFNYINNISAAIYESNNVHNLFQHNSLISPYTPETTVAHDLNTPIPIAGHLYSHVTVAASGAIEFYDNEQKYDISIYLHDAPPSDFKVNDDNSFIISTEVLTDDNNLRTLF